MMCTALDVANYFVYLLSDIRSDLTNMKLNKLVYYAQGHCLQITGQPMFPDQIEAWEHGPVVYQVYTKYKSFDNLPVQEYDPSLLPNVEGECRDILLYVAREYGNDSAADLRKMTHEPGGPWDQAYREDMFRIPIPQTTIQEYFDKYVKKIGPLVLNTSEEDYIGYRDADGCLVLPRDGDVAR